MIERDVASIQACFPEVYFACHTEHRVAPANLTPRDGTLLAHIAAIDPVEIRDLARHLGRAKSTLSAAVKKLESLGLVTVTPVAGDARRRHLAVTEAGRVCIGSTSVLETDRLTAVLRGLRREEREAAVRGLQLLAKASRRFMGKKGKN